MSYNLKPRIIQEIKPAEANDTAFPESAGQVPSVEQELNSYVQNGDWELVIQSPVFEKRTPEGQAQLISQAIDNRIEQLNKDVNRLVNRGPSFRAASMGVLERIAQLENARDEILKRLYEQHPRTLSQTAGVKIDFY